MNPTPAPATAGILTLLPFRARLGVPLIAITGSAASILARAGVM